MAFVAAWDRTRPSREAPAIALRDVSEWAARQAEGSPMLPQIHVLIGLDRPLPHALRIIENESGRLQGPHRPFRALSGQRQLGRRPRSGPRRIRAGEFFGEMALDGGARSASVRTIVPSTCCVVHRAELHQFLADHPDFALHLAHKLIRMVRVVTEQVKSLALQNVHGRLVRVLTELSDPVGDVRVVRQKLTQQDIADRIGSSRERVNRVMKELAAGGYLSGHHGRYKIHRKFPPGW